MSEHFDKERWAAAERSLQQVTGDDELARAEGDALYARALEMSADDWEAFRLRFVAMPARAKIFCFTAAALRPRDVADDAADRSRRVAVHGRLIADYLDIFGVKPGSPGVGTWPKVPEGL